MGRPPSQVYTSGFARTLAIDIIVLPERTAAERGRPNGAPSSEERTSRWPRQLDNRTQASIKPGEGALGTERREDQIGLKSPNS